MNPIAVYLSGHDLHKTKLLADMFRSAGYRVVSTWHDEIPIGDPPGKGPPPGDPWWIKRIGENTAKIVSADALVLLAGPEKYTGGKFVEFGVALASGKKLFIFGDRYENGMVSGATLISSPEQVQL